MGPRMDANGGVIYQPLVWSGKNCKCYSNLLILTLFHMWHVHISFHVVHNVNVVLYDI